MRDSEKKLKNGGSKKSTNQKAGIKCQGKKHKLESKSHKHSVGTNIPKKRVTDPSPKGPHKDSSNKKLISGQNLHKTDRKFSQKPSSKPQGKKVSFSCSKEGKDAGGEVQLQKIRRKRKKKRQMSNVDLDEASRLQRRTRYLLIKMKLEQNLIDAYTGEGWKGQSREKIRPEKELQRAWKQILKCKLGLRDAIHQLDSLSPSSSIEDSVIAPNGSIYHEHKFCAECKLGEALPDNDIILCAGTCNRAFHQKCLDPPLDTENIPPGDQGWLCKICECKMAILEAMNAHLGTHFSLHCTWQDVFKEEAALPDGDTALLNPEEEWPSDDSEDDDYNPDRREDSHKTNTTGTDDDASDDSSIYTSLCSSDGECSPVDDGVSVSHEYFSVNSSMDSDESEDKACGRRQRKAVDYKKLYDEMFGKDAPTYEQVSEDEDWGPSKRKRREKESDAIDILMTLHESENRHPNVEHNNMTRGDSSDINIRIKRRRSRIPPDAVERLRQVFAVNELPSKSVKEDLSKELGLDTQKVSKWFKNARYLALKTRKDSMEISDDVSLKKLLKERKKRVNSTFEGESQAAELEFERLSKLKIKVDSMKQKLTGIQNCRVKSSDEPYSNVPSIIYVPTAVLREKVEL